MAVRLEKGHKISLDKEAGHSVARVSMGLGWSAAQSGGFLGKLLPKRNIDLDASCLMIDANKHIVDSVWFQHLVSCCGSVRHSGDNLVGKSGGDTRVPDEVITVDLKKMPSHIKTLVFTVCSFQGQTFSKVQNAFCSLTDLDLDRELSYYDISGGGNNNTSLIMCKLYWKNDEWKMAAIGEYCNGRTIHDLTEPVLHLL